MSCGWPSCTRKGCSAGSKLVLIPFFLFHYGMFTLVHGVFVVALFSPVFQQTPTNPADFGSWTYFLGVLREHLPAGVLVGLAGLVASHGVSFFSNFIGQGEYRRTDVDALMMKPYGRVILLHLTVLASGFIMLTIGVSQLGLAVLVLLKIGMDLRAHWTERKRLA